MHYHTPPLQKLKKEEEEEEEDFLRYFVKLFRANGRVVLHKNT